jgi:hypothetical protein
MMLAVAAAGVVFGLISLGARSSRFREQARIHAIREERFRETLPHIEAIFPHKGLNKEKFSPDSIITLEGGGCVSPPSYYHIRIQWHSSLKQKYRRAMWHPWEVVPPDPPVPREL